MARWRTTSRTARWGHVTRYTSHVTRYSSLVTRQGSVQFYPDDLGGRKVFEGHWVAGRRDGPGKMTWQTGEVGERKHVSVMT